MKFLATIALLLSFVTHSQLLPSINTEEQARFGREHKAPKDSIHGSLLPYHRVELDWISKRSSPYLKKGIWDEDFQISDGFKVFPLVDLEFGGDLSAQQNNFVINNSIGAGALWQNSKWRLNANYQFGYWQANDHILAIADSAELIPTIGYAIPFANNYATHTATGSASFTPNTHFSFELGRGKHFLGNGYRSLMLSDNALPYPYFKIDTRVWKVRYTNIFSSLKDMRGAHGDPSLYVNKFTSSHYLDWNVTNQWSLGVFETIVWQAKDTLLNRGFDINYLNPIIFYRPVEFSQGSSDNAILGLNSLVKIKPRHHLYNQFVIDEFLLSAIKQDINHFVSPKDTSLIWGWWANKFAFQIGYKYFDVAGISGLDLQTEINLIRPFMYAHGSVHQNYGHMNQSMAHPRGANFYEWVNIIRYEKDNFRISNKFIWSNYGTDTSGTSFGGDIYQPYQNRVSSHYNQIGQGVRNVLLYNDLKLSFIINPKINLEADLGYMIRYNRNRIRQDRANYFYVALRTKLWNRYTDH